MLLKSNRLNNIYRLLLNGLIITAMLITGSIGMALPNTESLANSLGYENWPGKVSVVNAAANTEWTQEAHDAQRTGFTAEEPLEPWSLAWTWNGPDANGGTGGHLYNAPKDAHTVTGGNYVYAPAGGMGLYALRKSDGSLAWQLASPAFNATPAYDPATGSIYAGGADGNLYKINSTTGVLQGTYAAGGGLNKAVLLVGSSAHILTDNGQLHKVNTANMTRAWVYSAGSNTSIPAAYSATTGLLIYATADLYVHAVREADGVGQWRVKPTSHPAQDPYTYEGFWPVIADQHGLVFIRLNLGWDALWSGPNQGPWGGGIYPLTNADTRALLVSNNGALQNLFALDLANGSQKFVPAVGYGGVELRTSASGSGLFLQSGPVPVVKVNDDGTEVAYIPFRSGQGSPPDGRWDSHMGEMVLDGTTVPGLAAGDMRFIDFPNSYVHITDEQTPISMAGNTIFHAHWGASDSTAILNRSAGLGISKTSPITTKTHPVIIRRQQSCSNYDKISHWTTCALSEFGDGRYWTGPGFWVYWNVMDPPTILSDAYSDGLLPRYTYASAGLMVVEGNGGDLSIFRYSGGAPVPTATPGPAATATSISVPTATRTNTAAPSATSTYTTVPSATNTAFPTATRTNTTAPSATRTNTTAPSATNPPAATATRTHTAVPSSTRAPTQPQPSATPGAITGSLTLKTFNDFSPSGATLTNTFVSDLNGGSVVLASSNTDHFAGTSLNTALWVSGSWTGGTYNASQTNSLLNLPGKGYVRSKATYTHGVMETTAQFGRGAWEHIGFGSDGFSANRYFLVSTYNGDGNLYARVNNHGSEQRVNLGAIPSGMHRYRIEWTGVNSSTDGIKFYKDGALVAQMTVNSSGASAWYEYLSSSGTAMLQVHQSQVTPAYVSSGTYYSAVLDAGANSTWQSASWTALSPAGTSLAIQTQTSTNGNTWSGFSTVASSGNGLNAPARYVRFQVNLGTTNPLNTPALTSIVFNKSSAPAATTTSVPPTVLPTNTQPPAATATKTNVPTALPSITPTRTAVPSATATFAPATATTQPSPVPSSTPTKTSTIPAPTSTMTRTATAQPTAAPTSTSVPTQTATQPPTSGRISNPQVITGSVAVHEKFEVQFNVQTSATNPDMPYEANPPAGVMPGIGVTVSGLFSADNWATTITQPGFLYQPYEHSVNNAKDHFTPAGAPVWAVRFAPSQAGIWQYRVSVKDSQGQSYYPDFGQNALSFSVGAVSNNPIVAKGVIGVSPTDQRYFQYQDGTPFIGVGFNDGFSDSASVEQKMTSYQQNQMNFMRVWMSGSGINGSQWSSWASNFLSQDGYLPGTSFDLANTYNGSAVSMRLDDASPCLYADFWQGGVPVEPNTQYQVTARVKLNNVTGPAAAGEYGFVIKQGDWLGTDCVKPGIGANLTNVVTGSTNWTTVSGTYTTGSSDKWLGGLYLTRENASGGQVYIDEVHLYRANDPAKVDLLRQPYANAVEHFGAMNAAQWDLYIASAETHGVSLKLVIDEKNEWIRNHMNADGTMTATGSNGNFYAAPGTKSRWLQEAWWRYIIARWGYSTAVHSFEYINEGDPYDGSHYEAAQAMAKYFHQNDPSRHMVTTSFWGAFPNQEFWSNPLYPDIDYVDLHAYISTGWGLDASFLPANRVETRPAYVHSGNASATVSGSTTSSLTIVPRGLVLKGAGEWVIKYWMKAEGLVATCPYSGSGSMLRVRWLLDGGPYNGGRQGVVPANSEAKDYVCTSPAGSFDWRQFTSTSDRDGAALPASARIILTDNLPHELNLLLENSYGNSGNAWIDDVQVIGPTGQVLPVIGTFDTTPLDTDTAWYNQAYAEVFGGRSPVGAHKPLVRGETGVDFVGNQNFNPDLLKDTQGIWLHNNVWGQINAGGMADLFWWASETIPSSIFQNFSSFRSFMAGIPLTNGQYVDSRAQTSTAQLRVMGQRDDLNGQMHLWVQNIQHNWKQVVNGPAVTAVSGTITLPGVAAGSYRVEWWDPYATTNPILLTQTVVSNGNLVLSLLSALTSDLGIKIFRIQ